MNKLDRRRLERIKRLIGSVPGATPGTQSAAVKGFVTYHSDMRYTIQKITLALNAMIVEGVYGYEEGVDYESPDTHIDDLEQWMIDRSKDNWQ